MKYAQITAVYSTQCFCEKPELGVSEPVPIEPRFEFRKAALRLADALGLENVTWNHSSYKSALATANVPCRHRAEQIVRLDWRLLNLPTQRHI